MNKSNKHISDKMEANIAKDMNGNVTRGSGSVFDDGDIKNKAILVEAKYRSRKSFTIDIPTLDKVIQQGRDYCRIPILVLENIQGRKIAVFDYDDAVTIIRSSLQ